MYRDLNTIKRELEIILGEPLHRLGSETRTPDRRPAPTISTRPGAGHSKKTLSSARRLLRAARYEDPFAFMLMAAHVDGVVRTYFIAADEAEWDYFPLGKDMMTEMAFNLTQPPSPLPPTRKRHAGDIPGSHLRKGHRHNP